MNIYIIVDNKQIKLNNRDKGTLLYKFDKVEDLFADLLDRVIIDCNQKADTTNFSKLTKMPSRLYKSTPVKIKCKITINNVTKKRAIFTPIVTFPFNGLSNKTRIGSIKFNTNSTSYKVYKIKTKINTF
jgi:hypothetical protein